MNEHLTELIPGWSLEAVKGKRRNAAYKAKVQQILGEIRDQQVEVNRPPASPPAIIAQDPPERAQRNNELLAVRLSPVQ